MLIHKAPPRPARLTRTTQGWNHGATVTWVGQTHLHFSDSCRQVYFFLLSGNCQTCFSLVQNNSIFFSILHLASLLFLLHACLMCSTFMSFFICVFLEYLNKSPLFSSSMDRCCSFISCCIYVFSEYPNKFLYLPLTECLVLTSSVSLTSVPQYFLLQLLRMTKSGSLFS